MEPNKSILRLTLAGFLLVPVPGLSQEEPTNAMWDCVASDDAAGWNCRPLDRSGATDTREEALREAPRETEAPQETDPALPADSPAVDDGGATPEPSPEPDAAAETPEPDDRAAASTRPDVALTGASTGDAVRPSTIAADATWSRCAPQQAPTIAETYPSRDSAEIELSADFVEGDIDEQATFFGDVVLRHADQELRASTVSVDQPENRFIAEGDILYRQEGLIFTATRAELDLDDEQGELREVEFSLPRRHARGTADRVHLEGQTISHYRQASYTTCDPGSRDWELRAGKISLDRETGVGTARNASLRFKKVPFLYTPYISFPIDDRRKSGLLTPSAGVTEANGVELKIPYYWNIAPNYDATFIPRYMDQRGLMLGGQFRYLWPGQEGKTELEYLDSDKEFGDARGLFKWRHWGAFSERLRTDIDVNYASDDEYFEDFGNSLSISSIRQIERRADLQYHGGLWNLLGRVQYYQPVDDTLTSSERSYSRLPQVLLTAHLPDQKFGLDYELHSEYAYFDRSESVVGSRIDVYPSISRPFMTAGAFLTPKVGLRHTQYDLDQQEPGGADNPSRTTTIASVDSGLFFDRPITIAATPWMQTLEPRIFYLYVEEKDQSELPVFDSAEMDFSFAQLFRENRFSGADRMGDAHQLTLALTTRLLQQDTGIERLRASLGQINYFRNRTVTLPGEPAELQDTSSLVAEVAARISRPFRTRATYLWDPDNATTERGAVQLNYLRDADHILNLSYRFRRDDLEQTDISTRWQVARNWYAVARWNYSLVDNTSLETFVGAEYESCCWLFRMVFRQYVNDTDVDNKTDALLFQLVLKGLTDFGDRVENLLEQGILGYTAEP